MLDFIFCFGVQTCLVSFPVSFPFSHVQARGAPSAKGDAPSKLDTIVAQAKAALAKSKTKGKGKRKGKGKTKKSAKPEKESSQESVSKDSNDGSGDQDEPPAAKRRPAAKRPAAAPEADTKAKKAKTEQKGVDDYDIGDSFCSTAAKNCDDRNKFASRAYQRLQRCGAENIVCKMGYAKAATLWDKVHADDSE